MNRLSYTVAEIAEMTGVSRPAIYREIRSGAVKAVSLGGRLVVPVAELDRLLSSTCEPAAEAPS